MKKLFIKDVKRTHGRLSPMLVVDFTDGTSWSVHRSGLGGISIPELRDATVVIALKENGVLLSMIKVLSFDEKGRPDKYRHLWGEPLVLDGTEEIIDCRKSS